MTVRAAIQEIVLAHRRRYGIRRVTATLRRQGMVVNHKRVERIMHEDNLLAIRHRKYILTTNAQHEYPVYVNLAVRMKVTAINQLWVTDITYIRLRAEFVYLAVVIDRYSRKAIGWCLDRTLAARIAVTALKQAIAERQPPPGVVVHNDQGIQFACTEFQDELQAHQMVASSPYTGKLSARAAGKPGWFESLKENLRRSLLRHFDPCSIERAIRCAPRMRFQGMAESIWSDRVSNPKPNLGRSPLPPAGRLRPRLKSASGGPRSFSSSADEFRPGYSLIGLLASIARLRFTRHSRS